MRALRLFLVAWIAGACVAPVPPIGGGPSEVVRLAFERIAAHDLPGAALLSCPGQRDPSGLPMMIPGITSPFVSVPTGSFAETLAMIDIDVSQVRVDPVAAEGGTVQVPVSGEIILRVDPVRAEAAIRAAVAIDPLPPDEATIVATLDAMRAGPTVLDIGRGMETVQVTRVGEAWLICEQPPSPAP